MGGGGRGKEEKTRRSRKKKNEEEQEEDGRYLEEEAEFEPLAFIIPRVTVSPAAATQFPQLRAGS